jgi:hypothetical protein
MKRTESDMIAKSPVMVKLGETEYPIKPLTILKAREWRGKLVAAVYGVWLPETYVTLSSVTDCVRG